MSKIVNYPFILFLFSVTTLLLSAIAGAFLRKRGRPLTEDEWEDFGIVQGGALTLLGLLIGFTFSMAISRYDQRKNFEEAEANAIGTEYVRAGLMPAAEATRARELLKNYLNQRVLFYITRDAQDLQRINADTAQLQNELWSVVQAPAVKQPTTVAALVLAGMNDVLNSQGYTQFAWWNRIPLGAWALLAVIAVGCNLLLGYGTHRASFLLIVLPLAVSASLFFIADIDSPRGGIIRVQPQNLLQVFHNLPSQ